eukprot:2282383-Karenia_brevis.AAC.1
MWHWRRQPPAQFGVALWGGSLSVPHSRPGTTYGGAGESSAGHVDGCRFSAPEVSSATWAPTTHIEYT